MSSIAKDSHVKMRDFLFNKYNKMTFSRKECAEILGISLQTLDRLTKDKKNRINEYNSFCIILH